MLSPEQEARCLVGSYPYHPDVVTYSAVIARELGDSSAHAPILHPDAPLELAGGAGPTQGPTLTAAAPQLWMCQEVGRGYRGAFTSFQSELASLTAEPQSTSQGPSRVRVKGRVLC